MVFQINYPKCPSLSQSVGDPFSTCGGSKSKASGWNTNTSTGAPRGWHGVPGVSSRCFLLGEWHFYNKLLGSSHQQFWDSLKKQVKSNQRRSEEKIHLDNELIQKTWVYGWKLAAVFSFISLKGSFLARCSYQLPDYIGLNWFIHYWKDNSCG